MLQKNKDRVKAEYNQNRASGISTFKVRQSKKVNYRKKEKNDGRDIIGVKIIF